jgi:hypothetical protein
MNEEARYAEMVRTLVSAFARVMRQMGESLIDASERLEGQSGGFGVLDRGAYDGDPKDAGMKLREAYATVEVKCSRCGKVVTKAYETCVRLYVGIGRRYRCLDCEDTSPFGLLHGACFNAAMRNRVTFVDTGLCQVASATNGGEGETASTVAQETSE